MDSLKPGEVKGFTLVEVLISIGITVTSASAVIALVLYAYKQSRSGTIHETLLRKRQEITQSILNNSAWSATLSASSNTNLSCVSSETDCSGITGPIDIYDPTGTLLINTMSSTAGFTENNSPCSEFSNSGNALCPIRIEVQWQALCTNPGCAQPMAKISILFRYLSDSSGVPINAAAYNIDLFREQPTPKTLLVKNISSGGGMGSCVVTEEALPRIKCWGYNGPAIGSLGQGNNSVMKGDTAGEMGNSLDFTNLGTNVVPIKVVRGRATCALVQVAAELKVKCWGEEKSLGIGLGGPNGLGWQPSHMGDSLPFLDFGTGKSPVDIASGRHFTCALLNDGNVKCWGDPNPAIGMGYEDGLARGDQPGEMGDSLPNLNLGTGRTAIRIWGGYSRMCAKLDNQLVKCWGKNENGVLGIGSMEDMGDEPGEMGDSLPYLDVGTGRTVKEMALNSQFHSCAVLDNDTVKCWGANNNGVLGFDTFSFRGDNPGEMGDALPTVNFGTGQTAKAIAINDSSTCVITNTDLVKCWGFGELLGYEDATNRGGGFPGTMGDNLPFVNLGTARTAIQLMSQNHNGNQGTNCAVLDNNRVKCWGHSCDGETGYGDNQTRGDGPGEMGDNLPYLDFGTSP